MKELKTIWLIFFITISFFIFSSCKRQEPQFEEPLYDLFPLKVGNEFYYLDEEKLEFRKVFDEYSLTVGTEVWKVISESMEDTSISYKIERKYNGIRTQHWPTAIDDQGILHPGKIDTTFIKDQVSYFNINQSKSSSTLTFLLFSGPMKFKRFQPVSEVSISSFNSDYIFRANIGLARYKYYYFGNQTSSKTFVLGRVKLITE